MDYVALGWEDEFSNGEHFNNNKPVIPDVAGIDLKQVLLRYANFVAHSDNYRDERRVFLQFIHNL